MVEGILYSNTLVDNKPPNSSGHKKVLLYFVKVNTDEKILIAKIITTGMHSQ